MSERKFRVQVHKALLVSMHLILSAGLERPGLFRSLFEKLDHHQDDEGYGRQHNRHRVRADVVAVIKRPEDEKSGSFCRSSDATAYNQDGSDFADRARKSERYTVQQSPTYCRHGDVPECLKSARADCVCCVLLVETDL